MLLRHGTALFIACRAIQALDEWLANLRVARQPVQRVGYTQGPSKTHGCFLDPAPKQASLVQALFPAQRADAYVGARRVVFCGHSLGGSVAQLLGLTYAQAQGALFTSEIFTFGSPRLWDSGFQKLLQRHVNHSRLYVWRDAVAERPSWYRYHAELESWQLSLHRKAKRSDPGRPGHWQVMRGWSAGNPFVEN